MLQSAPTTIKAEAPAAPELDLSLEDLLQEVPVAMRFIFRAVTQESHRSLTGQVLEQAERELLPVVLDLLVAVIDSAVFAQLPQVEPAEFRPRDFSGENGLPQLFTRPEICHPDIVAIARHAAATTARGQYAQSIHLSLDGRLYRFRSDHFDILKRPGR